MVTRLYRRRFKIRLWYVLIRYHTHYAYTIIIIITSSPKAIFRSEVVVSNRIYFKVFFTNRSYEELYKQYNNQRVQVKSFMFLKDTTYRYLPILRWFKNYVTQHSCILISIMKNAKSYKLSLSGNINICKCIALIKAVKGFMILRGFSILMQ